MSDGFMPFAKRAEEKNSIPSDLFLVLQETGFKYQVQIMDKHLITTLLLEKGLFKNKNIEYIPLRGGVSSDIFLVTDGNQKFVVKQALSKLQVEDDWYADPSRNQTEQKFIRYISRYLPENVPRILYSDASNGFFVMEFLGPVFQNWKEQLLQGKVVKETVKKAAELLSILHLRSWQNKVAEQEFDTTSNFKSLRIEPYLITTGNRHPGLKKQFYAEALRLETQRTALVHGDFSPKNMMVSPDRLVLLDHEVAWYGDPAFDVAFFLNHLYLKQLYHVRSPQSMPDLARIAWDNYYENLGPSYAEELETGISRLLLMLMLARVDGKSPVEYLDEIQKEFIRSFVYPMLTREAFNLADIRSNWNSQLETFQSGESGNKP
ncbi:MAG: aminoglycoside phosphotransferase family protein [Balneolaceae bacterium]